MIGMEDENAKWSRRAAVKTLAAGTLTLGGSGVVQAQERGDETETVAEGQSMALSEENALSQRELTEKVGDISQQYGADVAMSTVPGKVDPTTGEVNDEVSTESAPSNLTNLNYLNTWSHEDKLKGGLNNHLLLTTDHFLSVYRSSESDSQNRWHYFYWHWSQTETNNDYWHPQSKLGIMRNTLNIHDDEEEVTSFSPKRTVDLNGRQKDIGVSVGYGGASFGMSGSVYVKDGSFGPETGGVDPGPSGKFSALLDANRTTGRQSLNATTVTREPTWRTDFADCRWEIYCKVHSS